MDAETAAEKSKEWLEQAEERRLERLERENEWEAYQEQIAEDQKFILID